MNPTQDIPKSETIDITNQPRQSTGSSTASLETIGDLEKKILHIHNYTIKEGEEDNSPAIGSEYIFAITLKLNKNKRLCLPN